LRTPKENTVKNRVARTGIAVLFAASLMLSMSAFAEDEGQGCSLARSAGKWSLTDNGTVVGIGPRTAVGVFTLDGNGNLLNGVAASSLNGNVASETFSGTYTVNSDCSGTFDVKIYSGGTELFELKAFTAFDDDLREMRAVFTSIVAPDGTSLASVISLQARKQ
jgi:hypothetical protein